MTTTPQKYKNTEIGSIPEDWELKLGNEISEKITKGASPRWQGFSYQNYGVLFVTSENVRDGRLEIIEPKYLPFSFTEKQSNSQLKFGDLLINIVGASIGRACIFNLHIPSNINQAVCLFRPNDKVNRSFLLHFFQSPSIVQKLVGTQSESARPNLSLTDIRLFKITCPPLPEQTAIANALNDADALITQLEKLIAKKRQIKQGAMQELLKPKEGWVEKKLGEILRSVQLGGNYLNSEKSTFYPLIKMGNIQRGFISKDKVEYIVENQKPNKQDKLYFGDVLFNTRNTLELVGKVAIWRNELSEAYFNSNLMRFQFDSDIISSNFFMNYIFNTKNIISKLKDIATGTTSVAAIYTRDLKNIELFIPSKEEQIQIAQTLSDMDAEIAGLEQKLDKYRKLKAGMMQNLLTGKIRLV